MLLAQRFGNQRPKTASHVEQNVHDVPILHHVLLPLSTKHSPLLRLRLAPRYREIVERHYLCPDEAPLQVTVDLPAATGAGDPASTVHARHSSGPAVRKLISPSNP